MSRRRGHRRRLGSGLLAFGVIGLLLIGAAGVLVLGSLAAVNDAATGFERQRAEILAMLGPASSALDNAATSAANAGASLTETSAAATRASDLTNQLATSFEGLAALGSFEIFGARPFASMAGQFSSVATSSRALAADLDAAAIAMGTNIADSQAVAADLRTLADQLETLQASLGGNPVTPGGDPAGSASLPVDAARLTLMGLLAWLAIPALASIWLGWRLLRWPAQARPERPSETPPEG